jgi:hypothetical protein
MHDFWKSSGAKTIRDTEALRRQQLEIVFFCKHLIRGTLTSTYAKCTDIGCKCGGWKENWDKGFLQDFVKLSRRMPPTTPSKSLPAHYMTLRDHLEAEPKEDREHKKVDYYLPSRIRENLGWCKFCPNFVWTSATERKSHLLKIHGAIANSDPESKLQLREYTCPVCNLLFKSKWALHAHRRRNQPCHPAQCSKKPKKPKKTPIAKGRFSASERGKIVAPNSPLPVPNSEPAAPAPVCKRAKKTPGPAKPFPCKMQGCTKAYVYAKRANKHMAAAHPWGEGTEHNPKPLESFAEPVVAHKPKRKRQRSSGDMEDSKSESETEEEGVDNMDEDLDDESETSQSAGDDDEGDDDEGVGKSGLAVHESDLTAAGPAPVLGNKVEAIRNPTPTAERPFHLVRRWANLPNAGQYLGHPAKVNAWAAAYHLAWIDDNDREMYTNVRTKEQTRTHGAMEAELGSDVSTVEVTLTDNGHLDPPSVQRIAQAFGLQQSLAAAAKKGKPCSDRGPFIPPEDADKNDAGAPHAVGAEAPQAGSNGQRQFAAAAASKKGGKDNKDEEEPPARPKGMRFPSLEAQLMAEVAALPKKRKRTQAESAPAGSL